MWYFSWILGVSLACSFGILNAMWFELRELPPSDENAPHRDGQGRS
jgi:cyd operon protein YbgT